MAKKTSATGIPTDFTRTQCWWVFLTRWQCFSQLSLTIVRKTTTPMVAVFVDHSGTEKYDKCTNTIINRSPTITHSFQRHSAMSKRQCLHRSPLSATFWKNFRCCVGWCWRIHERLIQIDYFSLETQDLQKTNMCSAEMYTQSISKVFLWGWPTHPAQKSTKRCC